PTAWTADGRAILVDSDRSGHWGIYAKGVTEASPERPIAVGPTAHRWPQLVAGGAALLYWDTPGDGPPSLMRAAFDGTAAAPATPLLVAPDLLQPLSANMRVRCPAAGSDCILLWAATESSKGWYRLDPRDGTRRPIDGLPLPVV